MNLFTCHFYLNPGASKFWAQLPFYTTPESGQKESQFKAKKGSPLSFLQMWALLKLCQFFSQQCMKCLFRGKKLGSFWHKLPYWGFKKWPIQCQHKKANTTSSENGSAMALDFKFFSLGCVYCRFPFGLIFEAKELWDYISH